MTSVGRRHADPERGYNSLQRGDQIQDPSGAPYRVLDLTGGRLLIRDADGILWVLARRRLEDGPWCRQERGR
jgi:hypothetical protein